MNRVAVMIPIHIFQITPIQIAAGFPRRRLHYITTIPAPAIRIVTVQDRLHMIPVSNTEQTYHQNFKKILNVIAVISVIGAGILLVLQAVYYYLNITKGVEYPYAYEANILNELFIVLISFGLGFLLRKKNSL